VIVFFLIINAIGIVVLWRAVRRPTLHDSQKKQEVERRLIGSRDLTELQDSVAARISEGLVRKKGIEISEEIAPTMTVKVSAVGSRNERLLAVQDAKWEPGMILF
jgi:hypothetical protein